MINVSRRTLVGGAAVLATAMAAPIAHAGTDPLRARVAALRERWLQDERDILLSVLPDEKLAFDDPLLQDGRSITRGIAALRGLKDVQELSISDQVHGAVQTLLTDLAGAFVDGLLSARTLAEAMLEDPAPGREVQLRGALRAVRFAVSDWDIGADRRRFLDEVLRDAEQDSAPLALRARVRKFTRKLDRAMEMARRAAAEPSELRVLERPSSAQEAELQTGLARWGADAQPSAALSRSESYDPATVSRDTIGGRAVPDMELVKLIFGLMLLGAVFMSGYIFFAVGLCGLVVGFAIAVQLIFIGLAVMAIALWAGAVVVRRTIRAHKAERDPLPPLDEGGMDGASLRINVLPQDGWVPTGARGVAQVRATGRVIGPRGWMANPDGDGVAAGLGAPLPGAPEAALIGRVGGAVFFLGAEGQLPPGADGPLELALNVDPGDIGRAAGFFHVALG